MENIATQQPQQAPNILQEISKLPPIALVVTVVLGFCVLGLLPLYAAAMLIGLSWWGLTAIERAQALKEAKARAATYANCIGPIVVSSIHPNETVEELELRCEEWRESLKLSGNPYAEKIPVIAMPYQVMLAEYGQLTAGWSTYQRQVGERQHNENIIWHSGKCPSELKALFASAVLPAPKQNEFQSQN
jgi:hypothetical protein